MTTITEQDPLPGDDSTQVNIYMPVLFENEQLIETTQGLQIIKT